MQQDAVSQAVASREGQPLPGEVPDTANIITVGIAGKDMTEPSLVVSAGAKGHSAGPAYNLVGGQVGAVVDGAVYNPKDAGDVINAIRYRGSQPASNGFSWSSGISSGGFPQFSNPTTFPVPPRLILSCAMCQ